MDPNQLQYLLQLLKNGNQLPTDSNDPASQSSNNSSMGAMNQGSGLGLMNQAGLPTGGFASMLEGNNSGLPGNGFLQSLISDFK